MPSRSRAHNRPADYCRWIVRCTSEVEPVPAAGSACSPRVIEHPVMGPSGFPAPTTTCARGRKANEPRVTACLHCPLLPLAATTEPQHTAPSARHLAKIKSGGGPLYSLSATVALGHEHARRTRPWLQSVSQSVSPLVTWRRDGCTIGARVNPNIQPDTCDLSRRVPAAPDAFLLADGRRLESANWLGQRTTYSTWKYTGHHHSGQKSRRFRRVGRRFGSATSGIFREVTRAACVPAPHPFWCQADGMLVVRVNVGVRSSAVATPVGS
jgi:hypothetical protein